MNFYTETIIDHYENPQNWGTLENPDIVMSGNNPLCGDVISLKCKTQNSKLEDIKFVAQGCAISVAAASLLSEEAKGKTFEQIQSMEHSDIIKLLGIELSPSRLKCGMLSLETLKEGIKIYEKR